MPAQPVNTILLALIVGMTVYQAWQYVRYRMTYRLGFVTFWFLLGVELPSQERWWLVPSITGLIYAVWKRQRVGKDRVRWLEDLNR